MVHLLITSWAIAKQYNHQTNLAELSIIDSAYSKAISHYDSAQLKHPLFASDRYNKAVCYALLGLTKQCKTELKYLLEKGLKREVITENSAFEPFLVTKDGLQLLSEKIDQTYNIVLRAIYDSLLYQDQYLRLKIPYGDEIKRIDSSNVKKMNSLIYDYGWPTDDLVGNIDLSDQVISLIINHQRNPATRAYDYTYDMYRSYANGQIEVHQAAWLISLMTQTDEFKSTDAALVTVLYDSLNTYKGENMEDYPHKTGFTNFSEKRKLKLDSNRLDFGLESIDDLRKKVKYFKNDDRFKISKIGWNSIFCYFDIKDYEYSSSNLILIE